MISARARRPPAPRSAAPRLALLGDLRARIVLAAVTVAVGLGATLTVVTIVREQRAAARALDTSGRQLVSNLAQNAVIGVLAGDRAQVERAARPLLDVPEVARVSVYRDSRLFVDLSRGASATPLPPRVPAARAGRVVRRRLAGGDAGAMSFSTPIVLEPSLAREPYFGVPAAAQVIGTASVILSLDLRRARRRATLMVNARLLVAATALAAAASLLLARRITLPLDRLSAAAELVGKGKLDVALPVESADAIGRLSANFNRMAADLRALEDNKRRFLAVVSHELRTPLVALKGYLQLATGGRLGEIPARLREPIAIMQRNVERLEGQVEALLLFSQIEAGKLTIDRAPCDLRACVLEAVEAIRPRLDARALTIEVALPASPLMVQGDRRRLVQVFDNLLSNALKFSPEGARIDLVGRREGGAVVAEVSDRGPGIPAELQERIFERFYQIHPTMTRTHPGVGLGLAIVHELVARHGGRIGVHRRPGGGSTFRLELPAVDG